MLGVNIIMVDPPLTIMMPKIIPMAEFLSWEGVLLGTMEIVRRGVPHGTIMTAVAIRKMGNKMRT